MARRLSASSAHLLGISSALRRGAACASRRFAGQRHGALQESRGSGEPARACARPAERSSSPASSSSGTDAACAVPRAAIRVELRIGCVRQRAVSLAPLVRLGRPPRTHQRMPEHHRSVQRQQAFRLHGARGGLGIPSCCAARHRSPRSPTGSAAARSSNRRVPSGAAPAAARSSARSQWTKAAPPAVETTGELGGSQPAREFQERKRISTCLRDDPVEYGLVEPRRQGGLQQHPGIPTA